MFRSLSLRSKLSLSVAGLAILILGLMTAFVAKQSFETAEKNAEKISRNAAHFYGGNIKSTLENNLLVARSYSQVLLGKKAFGEVSRDAVNRELQSLLVSNPGLIGSWTGWEANAFDGKDAQWVQKPGHDATGRFIPYWSYDKGQAYLSPLVGYEKTGDGDYYLVPKARKKETLVEPYIYPVAGVPTLMTSAVVPILINGEFKGVAGVDIGLKDIQSRVATIKPYDTSEAYLVSPSGAWISHPKDELITKAAKFAFESDKILASIQKGEELSLTGFDSELGENVIYTIEPVKIGQTDQAWGLIIRTPTAAVLADARTLLFKQIFTSLLGALLLIMAVFALAHLIAKSMNQLSGQLEQSSQEVNLAIQQLTQSGQNLSQASAESAASLEETVASLEEMNSMVQRNSESAKVAADLSTETKTAAAKGQNEMTELLQQMVAISQSSRKIEEIITVIDDIAFQTNLLALNAAVEAARAGEQGKGFAVVAEAVRNLAQRSAVAAKDINDLIRTSVTQVESGKTKAEVSGKVLKEMADSIEKVANLNGEISRASEEQATGVSQISKAMTQLDHAIQSNAASSEEIASTAEEIASQTRTMKSVVEEMHTQISGSSGAPDLNHRPADISPAAHTPRKRKKAA